jgi:uncharacterized membrane protein YbhN (UPF0104 family)
MHPCRPGCEPATADLRHACVASPRCQKRPVRLTAFLSSPAGTALRYACSLGLLAWFAARIDWAEFGLLSDIEWSLALPAMLLAGTAYPLLAVRWQVLLRALGIHLRTAAIHRVYWIGQFYSAFLPAGIAGDAVRFAQVWRHHPDRKAAAVAALAADRLLGLAALCALAVLAVALHLGLGGQTAGLEPLVAGATVAFAVVFLLGWTATRPRVWEPLTRRLLGAERAAALHDAAVALGRAHAALVWATVLSVAVWLIDFAAVWLLAQSVGLPASPLAVSIAAAGAYVAAALPISIGGHGVREGALAAVLVLFGHRAGPGSALSVLVLAFWAMTVTWSLVGGLVALTPAGREQK